MVDLIVTIVIVAGIALVFTGGYVAGRHNGRIEAEEAADRLLRIDPPNRTLGAPTNLGAQPSATTRPRWSSGRFKSGPTHNG